MLQALEVSVAASQSLIVGKLETWWKGSAGNSGEFEPSPDRRYLSQECHKIAVRRSLAIALSSHRPSGESGGWAE